MSEQPPIEERSRQFVTFSVGGEAYAADILTVREVVRTPEITRFPRPDVGVIGVVNVRGRILPVADAGRCLDLAPTREGSRILIADSSGETYGLLVDSVDGVTEIADSAMRPVPPSWQGRRSCVSALASLEGRLLAVVNLDEFVERSTAGD